MGFIRGGKFDKYSDGDDRFVSDLPKTYAVVIHDGEENIYKLLNGNKTTPRGLVLTAQPHAWWSFT